ncbi:MAG: 16S rRNA (cytosine(1402)-N(4))-methyltransferase RsmH [Myxococcales bacterium]|nr:16S rRNA (cytosine(1402)-N(4))-methyltransferase RsmH [Myxococcales bacterium]
MNLTQFHHLPVLPANIVAIFKQNRAEIMFDGTVGGGGHAEMLLETGVGSQMYIGIDRDPSALVAAQARLERFGSRVILRHRRFSDLENLLGELGVRAVDGLLVDLGASSPQLDVSERGFGFRTSGPLDMRMDPTSGRSLSDYLNVWSHDELTVILRDLGEVPGAKMIAQKILDSWTKGALRTTGDLALLIERAAPAALRKRKVSPATLVFQALRCAVNNEPEELAQLLVTIPRVVAPGGTVAVISFQSLEDRPVKHRFRELTGKAAPPRGPAALLRATTPVLFEEITHKAITPTAEECERNPRARSAKLRAIRRRM